jgi:hypothetical protein
MSIVVAPRPTLASGCQRSCRKRNGMEPARISAPTASRLTSVRRPDDARELSNASVATAPL